MERDDDDEGGRRREIKERENREGKKWMRERK